MLKSWAERCGWAPGHAICQPARWRRKFTARKRLASDIGIVMNLIRSFAKLWSAAGLVFSGVSPDGKFVEIVELPRDEHPWFLGCQFHPEYKSKPLSAHPLFSSFVRAAYENRMQNETSMDKNGETELLIPERASVVSAD